MVERSGRTFIDRGGLGNTLRALSYSIFGGQHPMAQHPRCVGLPVHAYESAAAACQLPQLVLRTRLDPEAI